MMLGSCMKMGSVELRCQWQFGPNYGAILCSYGYISSLLLTWPLNKTFSGHKK